MADITQLKDGNGYPTKVGSYAHITATGSALIKNGPGFLYAIVFNTPVATSVVQYDDNNTASRNATAAIGTITVGTGPQPFTLPINLAFSTGLAITTATAASDITVVYR